jgi:hypothetical protein
MHGSVTQLSHTVVTLDICACARRFLRSAMTRIALRCFEELPDGSWICRNDISITGRACEVFVRRNQLFARHTIFAGFGDFTAYLASVSEMSRDRCPHEWSA